jgi:23S rRNA pseudouridine1911/1915/1917 synthase
VLYEDDAILIVNKPAGIVVHPSYKRSSGTLLNVVLWRMRGRSDVQPGILTRLDKDTSGLVVIALTPAVHAAMQRDAAAGRFGKEYLAIVAATPSPAAGTIDLPLARDPADRRRVVVFEGGAPSVTHYEVVSSSPDGTASLLRCTLATGRTHQIRVHLAAKGWPIVGDAVYGVPYAEIQRQALHAWRVTFPHPTSGAPIAVEAPLPDDMQRVATKITKTG